jgi:hypothetical protein
MRWPARLLLLLLSLGTGCFYQPPPPMAVASLREGHTAISLHLTADLLAARRGEALIETLGFYPSLRWGLSEDQEMLFYPWPAYRHWVCLDDDRRAYHQVSLGGIHPLRPGPDFGRVQYLRYDFRASRPRDEADRHCEPLGPEDEVMATVTGFWLSVRGGGHGRGVLGLTTGLSASMASDSWGLVLEPGLFTLLPNPAGGLGPTARWLPELRAAGWGGR